MSVLKNRIWAALLISLVALPALPAGGQARRIHIRAFASNVVMPQSRSFSVDRRKRVEITGVKVAVVILEQVATTRMDISLKNPTGSRMEAELLVPVPEGAVVKGFTFQGAGKEPSAVLLPKEKAVATYKSIVARIKDPALLEFVGYNLIRSSVFPIAPNGTQKVRLTYENLLPADGSRIDYILPRSESINYDVPWEISVRIKSRKAISTVYSPSHKLEFRRIKPNVVSVKIAKDAMTEPGPFQLSYLQEEDGGVTASLLAYPDPKVGGGYFLLLAGLPVRGQGREAAEPAVKREITVVIDRSGSMAGEKLAQAKAAALQVVQGLLDGEKFNIIDYSDSISTFAPAPVVKSKKNLEEARHYIRSLRSGGGTNIHDVLIEALRQKPTEKMLPIVLFLTDGLPTVGVRNEVAIRNAAIKANTHKRRIFTFGVGFDVNTPLLRHIAHNSRAVGTFVLPKEDVEVKVSQVYRRLFGPVLSEPVLTVVDSNGEPVSRRVADLLPAQLPDMFEGDRLVLLGKYTGEKPLGFRLKGDFRGKPKTFKFNFKLDKATTKNSFVPRLWASRKIGVLIDAIRQAGAEAVANPSVIAAGTATDPKMKELVDEIVRLSIEFGILTEYTAFLAKEGTDLNRREAIRHDTNANLYSRAVRGRSGKGAMNQAYNNDFQLRQTSSNRRNWFLDKDMNRVQVARVQQMNDRAFFRRGSRWVDGNAINSKAGDKPDSTVKIGSPAFMKLLDRLVADNRQGTLSMSGEIVLRIDGKNILITSK